MPTATTLITGDAGPRPRRWTRAAIFNDPDGNPLILHRRYASSLGA